MLEWLGRSAQTPLDVILVHKYGPASVPLTEEYVDVWKPLIDIANGCSSRWRTFNVYVSDLGLAYITGDGHGTCILEYLKVAGPFGRSDSYPFSLTNAIPMPTQLVSIAMPLRLIDINWSNLITIEIGELYVNEILALLRWVPRLTRCTLNYLEDGQDEHLPPPTPTHHHTLQKFDIQDLDYGEIAEQLLNLLILPSLVSLSFNSVYNSPENVAAFLDRSVCRLTTLIDVCGNAHDLLALAPRLPALERLEYPGHFGDNVQRPILGEEIGHNILPNLRELLIHGRVSWRFLVDLILLCPLKTLSIHIDASDANLFVDEESARRFEDLIKNGYKIKITSRVRGESEDRDLLAQSRIS